MNPLPRFIVWISLLLGAVAFDGPALAGDFVGPPAPPRDATTTAARDFVGPPAPPPESSTPAAAQPSEQKGTATEDLEMGLEVLSRSAQSKQVIYEGTAKIADKVGDVEAAKKLRGASEAIGESKALKVVDGANKVLQVKAITEGDAMAAVDMAVDKLCEGVPKPTGALGTLACEASYEGGKWIGRWIEKKCTEHLGEACGSTAAKYWGEKAGDAFGGDPVSMAGEKIDAALDKGAAAYGDWQQCRQNPQFCEGTPENAAWKKSLDEKNRKDRFDALDKELEKATSSSDYKPISTNTDFGVSAATTSFSNQTVQINSEFSARVQETTRQVGATQQVSYGASTSASAGPDCTDRFGAIIDDLNRQVAMFNQPGQECAALQSGLNSLRSLEAEVRRCSPSVDTGIDIQQYQSEVNQLCSSARLP